MRNIVEMKSLAHRSRDRIRDLGEVFTPETYVEDMLDILAVENKNMWSDENISFFEPCCGHGNIVIPIYRRRLNAIFKKAVVQGFGKTKEAPLYAVANALNTLWAIDIDSKNIENTRSRVLHETLEFLKDKLNVSSSRSLIAKNKDFFAHIISAIKWHIDENETLSALSTEETAKRNASLTKSSNAWLNLNVHNKLDFELTWVSFFEACEESKTIPIEYERSLKFINGIISGRNKATEEFKFATIVFHTMTEADELKLEA